MSPSDSGPASVFTKDDFVRYIEEAGIDSRNLFYSIPTQCGSYAYLGKKLGDFPEAEYCSDHGTHIGIHQDLEETNIDYARRCVRDSLTRNEAPIASHLLYTQPTILDDNIPEERQLGIDAGLAWRTVADKSIVYTDLGISKGMEYGIAAAKAAGIPIEYRSLDN